MKPFGAVNYPRSGAVVLANRPTLPWKIYRRGVSGKAWLCQWKRLNVRKLTPLRKALPKPLHNSEHLVGSKNSCGLTVVVLEESTEPFATLNQAFTRAPLPERRQEEGILLPLM